MVFFACINCKNQTKSSTNHITCRCLLSPTSAGHDTYLIEVNDSGIISTSLGWLPDTIIDVIKKGDNISPNLNLIEMIEKKKTEKMPIGIYRNLIKLIDNLKIEKCENPFVEGWFWDAWLVILIVDNKQFVFVKNYHPNKEIDEIVNELISLSPIPVSFDKMVGGRRKIGESSE